MSQNNSNAKTAMLAKLDSIHKVEGFDPSPFAVDYTDLNTQETRKRLPVMIQMAWFRLKYPEGRIAIQVSPGKDCFVATARIYARGCRSPTDRYCITQRHLYRAAVQADTGLRPSAELAKPRPIR